LSCTNIRETRSTTGRQAVCSAGLLRFSIVRSLPAYSPFGTWRPTLSVKCEPCISRNRRRPCSTGHTYVRFAQIARTRLRLKIACSPQPPFGIVQPGQLQASSRPDASLGRVGAGYRRRACRLWRCNLTSGGSGGSMGPQKITTAPEARPFGREHVEPFIRLAGVRE
jgi:hypothetical protein